VGLDNRFLRTTVRSEVITLTCLAEAWGLNLILSRMSLLKPPKRILTVQKQHLQINERVFRLKQQEQTASLKTPCFALTWPSTVAKQKQWETHFYSTTNMGKHFGHLLNVTQNRRSGVPSVWGGTSDRGLERTFVTTHSLHAVYDWPRLPKLVINTFAFGQSRKKRLLRWLPCMRLTRELGDAGPSFGTFNGILSFATFFFFFFFLATDDAKISRCPVDSVCSDKVSFSSSTVSANSNGKSHI